MNLHTSMGRLVGDVMKDRRSPVGGHRIIGGMIPCNVIPDEILTDHPQSLSRDDRRERQPDPFARRQPADARGDRFARHRGRDRRRDDRDARATRITCCPRRRSMRSGKRRFSPSTFRHNSFYLRAPIIEPLAGHAARGRDPSAAGSRDGRVERRRPRAAARGRGEGTERIRDGISAGDLRKSHARLADADRALRDARADAGQGQRGRRDHVGRGAELRDDVSRGGAARGLFGRRSPNSATRSSMRSSMAATA